MVLGNNKVCGILFCYNEEHIIGECLQHYLSQGMNIVVVDNLSTDSSIYIVRKYQQNEGKYAGRILDVLFIETRGFELDKILYFACEYMHKNLYKYEWIMLLDADAFYYSPVRGMTLLEFMDTVKKYGYNIINGMLYDFLPTDKDDPAIVSHIRRIRYYRTYQSKRYKKFYLYRPRLECPEQKIFLYHPSIDFYTYHSHICLRNGPRIPSIKFLYHHYPWVSYEHGIRKIFLERKPRFIERKTNSLRHPQYLGLLPIKKDLIRPSREGKVYNKDKVLISRLYLFLQLKFDLVNKFANVFNKNAAYIVLRRSLINWLIYIKVFKNMFLYDSEEAAFRYLYSVLRRTFKFRVKESKTAKAQANVSSDNLQFFSINFHEAPMQQAYAFGMPKNIHFLLRSINLQNFKTIIGNIPAYNVSSFIFNAGDGDSLCEDLFAIVQCAKDIFPHTRISVKNNGLLAEPARRKRFWKIPCFQPWETIVIDCDGDIYPCTRGLAQFNKKIKSGEYRFGNLLREHLTECWNNDYHLMLRRTCSRFCREDFIPECKNCRNTI